MALLSPGVQVSVIDQSNYTPAAASSVPFILLATAQNKVSGAGTGIAPGTLAANANKLYVMTSQRDLLSTFGVPFFYNTTAGTPINGYELNEYGLLAAYSALGSTNIAYVMRADIDLAALTASLSRPVGAPANGSYWLDTTNSVWGIKEWNQTTGKFTDQTPSVITDTGNLFPSSTVPLPSFGTIGQYAVVATNLFNPIYYKRSGPTDAQAPFWSQDGASAGDLYNTWVQVGSNEWKTSWPTIQGTNAPATLVPGNVFDINDVSFTVPGAPNNTVTNMVELINQSVTLQGVYAANIGGKLSLYADSSATNDGSTEGTGVIAINNRVGTPLATLGITAGQYAAPSYLFAPSYQVPRWNAGQPQPAPTGSVFQQTNANNKGMALQVKRYNSTLGSFVLQATPAYATEQDAVYGLDPSGGGANIPAGSTYADMNPYANNTASVLVLQRLTTGPTIITGDVVNPTFVPGDEFEMVWTVPGTADISTATVVLAGDSPADFEAAVSAAVGSDIVSATVDSAGAIVFTHKNGGSMAVYDLVGTPIADAGFNTSVTGVRNDYNNGVPEGLILSNWVTAPTFVYTASAAEPSINPTDGTLWYYSDATTADIMIQNNGAWQGYQNVTNDVRGYNLSLTNALGPIFSATAPTTQNDAAESPLVEGDLWIDTADLENYPMIYRWQTVNGELQWVQLNNADQVTSDGILFADARWAPNGTTNVITDPIPPIATGSTPLITSDYVDLDAPNPLLYPEGMLLFNTRRSGFNVKSFQVNYFNGTTFPGETLPSETDAWVTASANRADGSPNMGHWAQRDLIVKALKQAIDTSTTLREQQAQFNLLSAVSYPELAPNLELLNNDRGQTGFCVVDTPLRLTPDEVVNWSTNNNGLGRATGDGNLSAGDSYSAAFYPSCTANDLTGNIVVTAPSHMMLRTIIRSDSVAYPWFAPAGLRRGVVDNALQIGYLNGQTGEFESLGVNQGLRDVLYTNNINPITFIPGTGIVNFGNHTLQGTATALDRINVARLVAYLRGRLEIIGNQYLFEPNDTITRQSITNQITSLMVDLVNKRGIYDYLVVCDLTNNTPATIDANELYVDIAIEPVKAVEFIYIPMRIQRTGTIAAQGTA